MTAAAPRTATRSQTSVEGAGRLLQLVRSGTETTITGLAGVVGVSRSTVTQRLDLLVEHGLAELDGPRAASRGRPAAHAVFVPGSAVVLVGQVGLSGSRLAVTDLEGKVLAHELVEADASLGSDATLVAVLDGLDRLLGALGRTPADVAGAGLGLPSPAEIQHYVGVEAARQVGWDADHGRRLREHYDAPAFLERDVDLLALAEVRRSWPEAEVLVCVKLGTLVDAAVVVRDAPLRGAHGRAGHLGALPDLEAAASGGALVRRLAEEGVPVDDVAGVVALARNGSTRAARAVREAGVAVGHALAPAVALLDPQVVVVWGYLAEVEEHLLTGLRHGLGVPEGGGDPGREVVTARLGALAGVEGAARLVLEHLLAPDAIDRYLAAGSWLAAVSGDASHGKARSDAAHARPWSRP